MSDNDKRLTRSSEIFEVTRVSIRDWMDCKYCRKPTPQFIHTEQALKASGLQGSVKLRCCWVCGSGLDIVKDTMTPREEAIA